MVSARTVKEIDRVVTAADAHRTSVGERYRVVDGQREG